MIFPSESVVIPSVVVIHEAKNKGALPLLNPAKAGSFKNVICFLKR